MEAKQIEDFSETFCYHHYRLESAKKWIDDGLLNLAAEMLDVRRPEYDLSKLSDDELCAVFELENKLRGELQVKLVLTGMNFCQLTDSSGATKEVTRCAKMAGNMHPARILATFDEATLRDAHDRLRGCSVSECRKHFRSQAEKNIGRAISFLDEIEEEEREGNNPCCDSYCRVCTPGVR